MPLTDVAIRGLKPDAKDRWYSDEKGLRLLVKISGVKLWRLKYRYNGKQKTLALGEYPAVTLKQVRDAVIDARRLLADGKDPSEERKLAKLRQSFDIQNSFESVASEWWRLQSGLWTDGHANRVWVRLNDNAIKFLGAKPMQSITPQEIILVIRRVEGRGALDVASRVLQDIRRVFSYAVQVGLVSYNPASDLSGVLLARKTGHRPSLHPSELPTFLRLLEGYDEIGRQLTRLAVQLLVLTFVRPGELRGARWDEFDFNEALWRIPAERMKMKEEHIVPLSRQSLALLTDLKPMTETYGFVFPSERRLSEPMSDNTMRRAIFKLGYDGNHPGKSKATPHGFRATASSILNEQGFNPDAIERQLSHRERDGVRAAYTHHARYLDDRREMMQWWADYLDQQRAVG